MVGWPFGVVFAVFPVMIGGVFATRPRGRFRALAAVVAIVHVVAGAVLFWFGGLAVASCGLVLLAAAIAPSPEDRRDAWARTRGHAAMLVVAALVVLGLAPWAAGLWPD